MISGLDRAIGESVKADESVFTIHDLSHPFVQGLVPERDARHMRVGQSARVRLVSNPITVFTGQIARSSRVVSSDNQALKVWLDVPELATAQVRDGQLANVSIVVEIGQSALAVPNSAILRDGSRDYVFIRKADGAMDRRPVVTGRRDDLWTEVLSGVTEGEDIAVNGVQRLQTAFASIR